MYNGLWTAAERDTYRNELTPWEAVSHDGSDDFMVTPETMNRALSTVSALIEALEHAAYCEGHVCKECSQARALLDALR